MHGLISLLPTEHTQKVEAIWQELEDEFGITGIHVTPYAHFSWQITSDYDFDRLEKIIREIAAQTPPFTIHTAGLGIFTGIRPVIYISVVKDEHLMQLHQRIWQACQNVASGLSPYYAPPNWMPHISLAYEDIHEQNIGPVMQKLVFRTYNWEMQIDNIALIYELDGETGKLKFTCQLKKDLAL